MNTCEFVDALCRYTLPLSAESVLGSMRSQKKGEEPIERQLRHWYESLSPESRDAAKLLVQCSVATMLFDLLVVLDNCRTLESGEAKGKFVLCYTKDGASTQLGKFPDLLHDNLPDFESLVAAAKSRKSE